MSTRDWFTLGNNKILTNYAFNARQLYIFCY